MNDAIFLVLVFNLAVAASTLLVLLLRVPIRYFFGPSIAYSLWIVVPLSIASVLIALVMQINNPIKSSINSPITSLEKPYTNAAHSNNESSFVNSTNNQQQISSNSLIAIEQNQTDSAIPISVIKNVDFSLLLSAETRQFLFYVWLMGSLAFSGTFALRQYRCTQELGQLRPYSGSHTKQNIYVSESDKYGPLLLGVFLPKIILPASYKQQFTEDQLALIIAHEKHHRSAGHAQINACLLLIRLVCWFNPFIHKIANIFNLDQEMACDAAVIKQNSEQKQLYAATMLSSHSQISVLPLACQWITVNNLKTRIKALKNKPSKPRTTYTGGFIVASIAFFSSAMVWANTPQLPMSWEVSSNTNSIAISAANTTSSNASTQPSAEEKVKSFSRSFEATSVSVSNVSAKFTIIPEDRNDIQVSMLEHSNIAITQVNDVLLLDGGINMDNFSCQQSTHEKDADRIEIRVPNYLHINLQGNVDAIIGKSNGGQIKIGGCSSASLADASGPLTIIMGGSSQLNAAIITEDILLKLGGSATADFGEIKGQFSAQLSSGSIINAHEVASRSSLVQLSGASQLHIDKLSHFLTGEINGGSVIEVKEANMNLFDMTISGASKAVIENGEIDMLRLDIGGRSTADIMSHAHTLDINHRSNKNVKLKSVGQLSHQFKGENSGNLYVGGKLIDT